MTIMLRRLTLPRVIRLLVTIGATLCIPFLLGLIRSSINPEPPDLEHLTPLESYYLSPNRSNRIVNPHPFEFLINPGSKVCEGSNIYLLVYVHSAPEHTDRRVIIRNTWGNVTQFDVPVKVVFIVGLPDSSNGSSIEDQIYEESEAYNDVIQENFLDTYYNMTYKAVAALKWIIAHCPQATFVLKTDDDAFVNMFSLLKLLRRMSAAKPSLNTRTIMCNLWKDQVPRVGKWKLDKSVFRFDYYPSFCQGLAFIMSRDIIAPLYNATFYTPFLQMDDVYLTGFVVLRIDGAKQVEMNSFYVRNVDLWSFIEGANWMEYLYSHIKDPNDIPYFWTAVKNVSWDP